MDRSSGGSIPGVIGAADRVLAPANAETRIIPGHGPAADPARLAAGRGMLVALRDRMKQEIAAGKTIEQVLAAGISGSSAKGFPDGHERFLRIRNQELSGR